MAWLSALLISSHLGPTDVTSGPTDVTSGPTDVTSSPTDVTSGRMALIFLYTDLV